MPWAHRTQSAIATGAGIAGGLFALSDRVPWTTFDPTPHRPAVNLLVTPPGVPLLACGLTWTGAILLLSVRWRTAVIACWAIAAGAMVTALVQTSVRSGIYLDQAVLLHLPASAVHSNAAGTIAATSGLFILLACTIGLAVAWIASARPAAAIRRAMASAVIATAVAASVTYIAPRLDPFSEPLPALAPTTHAP